MNRCRRVGQDVTKKCNARCKTCFYRYRKDFNEDFHKPIEDLCSEANAAKARGCNHSVLVGWGEPTLYKNLDKWQGHCNGIGLTTSIITNGVMSSSKAEELYLKGLDHLHISVHGKGETLDNILELDGAHKMQEKILLMLKNNRFPWRSNTTLQQENYKKLPEIAEYLVEHRCRHIVFLGFLPHYEWQNRLHEVAVHPEELSQYIETASEIVLDAGIMLTIRYHPMCTLDQSLWKYVVNARYVLYDPWEWDYGHAGDPENVLWNAAVNEIGGAVAIQDNPCKKCDLFMHCGGWNKTYAKAFNGGGIQEVKNEDISQIPGWLHDQNPANHAKGYFGENCSNN